MNSYFIFIDYKLLILNHILIDSEYSFDPEYYFTPDKELKDYIRLSHQIVAQGLTKKKQRELGFLED